MFRQFRQQVGIAGDEVVLGEDGDGVAAFGEDFETTPRQLDAPLDGLVWVGRCPDGQRGGPVTWGGKFPAQQGRGVFFYEDLGLEVQAGGETEELVVVAGKTVGAALLLNNPQ